MGQACVGGQKRDAARARLGEKSNTLRDRGLHVDVEKLPQRKHVGDTTGNVVDPTRVNNRIPQVKQGLQVDTRGVGRGVRKRIAKVYVS